MEIAKAPILIVAGGTGGHVYPALCVAQLFQQLGHSIQWLGTAQGIESRLVPANNIELNTIDISGFRKIGWVKQLLTAVKLIKAIVDACRLVTAIQPKLVIGFGGYVAAPAGIAAKICAKPLIIHEQNAIAGSTNKLLSPLAKIRFSAFPNSLKNAIHSGNPIRAELTALNKQPVANDRPLRLLIVGGSSGAKKLNQVLPATLSRCTTIDHIEVRHQSGERWLEQCQASYNALRATAKPIDRVSVTAYIEDMAAAYQWADVVICRAGAITVWEIATVGIAALLIPFPYAIDDHQTANANWLVDAKAAMMIQERDIVEHKLAGIIDDWNHNRQQLNNLANNARACAVKDSAQLIVNQSLVLL